MDKVPYKKLLINLQAELKFQNKVLTLLTEEREKIVKLDADQLDKIRLNKEKLFKKLNTIKEDRENLLNIDNLPENFTLTTLFEKSGKDLKKEFNKLADDLKKTVKTVRKLNEDNGVLLKQSLSLVSSTMSILSAKPQVDNKNYSRKGQLQNQNQKQDSPLGVVSSLSRSA